MSEACRGCDHWRGLNDVSSLRICHYCLDTGRCRSLICPPGEGCTVREAHGKPERAPRHKYDFPPKERREAAFCKLYDEGKTDPEIASAAGVHPSTVYDWRKRTGRKSNWEERQKKSRQRGIDRELVAGEVTEDPCLTCRSREICAQVNGTCNAKARWERARSGA